MRHYTFVIIGLLLGTIITQAQDYEVITPDNVHRLERVASLGHGYVSGSWFPDNETLIVKNYENGDEWVYDVTDMSAPPIFHANAPEWRDIPQRYVVNVDRDANTLTVRNPKTERVQLRINYHETESIYDYFSSSDGRYISVITTEKISEKNVGYIQNYMRNVAVWDTLTAQRIMLFQIFAPRIVIEFSNNSHYMALFTHTNIFYNSGGDYIISLYNMDTKQKISEYDNGLYRDASSLSFSPDSTLLAITYWDGKITLINTINGAILADVDGYGGYAEYIHFEDGFVLVTKSDGYTDWYNMHTHELVERVENCPIIAMHPTKPLVLCNQFYSRRVDGMFDNIAPRVLNLVSGETIDLIYNQEPVGAITTGFYTSDGDYLITGSTIAYGDLILWDIEKYIPVPTFNYATRDTSCTIQSLYDDQYLGASNQLLIWDVETYEIKVSLPYYNGLYSDAGDWAVFQTIDYSRERRDTTTHVWRLSQLIDNPDTESYLVIEDEEFNYLYISASIDGQLLFLAMDDKTRVVVTEKFTIIYEYPQIGRMTFSPDGRYLIYYSDICGPAGFSDESLHIGTAQVWAVPMDE